MKVEKNCKKILEFSKAFKSWSKRRVQIMLFCSNLQKYLITLKIKNKLKWN